jgi:hypothetical protein
MRALGIAVVMYNFVVWIVIYVSISFHKFKLTILQNVEICNEAQRFASMGFCEQKKCSLYNAEIKIN